MTGEKSNTRENLRLELVDEAIKLATQGQWDKATKINRKITKQFPDDYQAYNRLGKALSEMGRTPAAKKAFNKSLEISPQNQIAIKNLSRLSILKHDNKSQTVLTESAKRRFAEDPGSTALTSLTNIGPANIVSRTYPGNHVKLVADQKILSVVDRQGERLGNIESKLASKLLKIMSEGYKFEGTVTSVSGKNISVIVQTTYENTLLPKLSLFTNESSSALRKQTEETVNSENLEHNLGQPTREILIKDWSDDDTEPGDDEVFNSTVHRIVSEDDELD